MDAGIGKSPPAGDLLRLLEYLGVTFDQRHRSSARMFPDIGTSGIAHAIQLALAPVFLLTAIGGLLGMMTGRLARVVDRARLLETQATQHPEVADSALELSMMAHRAHMLSWAIALCTTTALLVAALVAIMFLGSIYGFKVGTPIAMLFILAMLALIIALSLFLRDVFYSTATLRFSGSTLSELSRRRRERRRLP